MSAVNDESDNSAMFPTTGIGLKLQQAREQKKLTIAEVATQLRFTRATIDHLEQEDWEKLHSRTYARGYLLNYVKFLGLPSDEMLAMFNEQYGEVERPTDLLMTKTLPDDKGFPWGGGLLVIVAIIIALVVYQLWSTPVTEVEQAATGINSDNMVVEPDLAYDDDGIRANPTNAQETRDVSKLDNNVTAPLRIESMPAEMASSEQENLTAPVDPVEVNDAETVAVSPETLSIEDESGNTLNSGEATLTLVVTEPSWIEVKDNGGNTLISRVLDQETIELIGPIPFSVRIGNVGGTALRFNNTPVDLAEFRVKNVARLTLGD
ncbi:RodZ domain-containing protein [Methylophaga sp. OBS3]|uniref:RodZ domain-containing protein n=1 Tax=Methylophaga sp. OBS3 TaxID=2991934 RepID=UPI00225AE54E|nr:RodZ domain-containing protein [Methylophaga sp. OBS3]MCX4189989.1 DUF4115 domain-containing protein [Methylophaga sp. OBS3]